MKNQNVLKTLFEVWLKKDFVIKAAIISRVKKIYQAMKSKNQMKQVGFSTKIKLRNFYIREYKPSDNAKQIKPYPVIEEGLVYVVLPMRGQVGSTNATKVPVPGVIWKKAGADKVIRFVNSKPEIEDVVKKMIAAGIKITNLKHLQQEVKVLKMVKKVSDDDDDN
jgi:hypothetical protein